MKKNQNEKYSSLENQNQNNDIKYKENMNINHFLSTIKNPMNNKAKYFTAKNSRKNI